MHYISLEVLLTAAFILWPRCTYGFGIREKADAVSGFWCISVRFCGFRTPLTPPQLLMIVMVMMLMMTMICKIKENFIKFVCHLFDYVSKKKPVDDINFDITLHISLDFSLWISMSNLHHLFSK